MARILKETKTTVGKVKDLRQGRSPFTAKSVLLAGALLIGSLAVVVTGSGKNAWLQSLAPGTMVVTGSYLGGFFIGWGACRALKATSVITGIAVAAVGLVAWLGWDGSAAQAWLDSTSAWMGENIEGAGRYLVSLLPSATAAGVGGVLGFKRK